MYLVELRPGKEELYRSTDELAAAIRSGDVDKHSRIYHRATSKWISVTLHPQFKAIISEVPPAPSAPPLPPLERANWTFFNDAADSLAGAIPDEPAAPEPADSDAADGSAHQQWRRPLALCVTGGLLILGMQVATSGPRPPWATSSLKPARSVPARAARAADLGTTVSLASNRTSYVVGAAGYDAGSPGESPTSAEPAADSVAESLPAAPRIRMARALREALPKAPAAPAGDARSVTGLLQRWTAAHDSARARLESGIRVARLAQLFAPTRLMPNGGLTETRMSLAGVANFIRVYRQQQATIDREYQDSFAVASKQLKWSPVDIRQWYAKPALAESPELAGLTSSLLEGIDSLFGVLDAQAGTYTVTEKSIAFEDASAAREYTLIRQRIAATVDSAKARGAGDTGPLGQLLQAIGSTRLPQAS